MARRSPFKTMWREISDRHAAGESIEEIAASGFGGYNAADLRAFVRTAFERRGKEVPEEFQLRSRSSKTHGLRIPEPGDLEKFMVAVEQNRQIAKTQARAAYREITQLARKNAELELELQK